MDLSTVLIDHIVRGVMQDKASKEVVWGVTQITEPSLEGATESTDIVDFLNSPIATLDRAKTLTFNANNALFDLGLIAAQFGGSRKPSSSTNTFTAPMFEEFEVNYSAEGAGTVTLKHTPAGTAAAAIPYIYRLDNMGNTVEKYAYAASAAESTFSFTNTTLTYPTGLVSVSNPTAKILVIYDYIADDSNKALEIVNSGDNFPKAGIFTMEVLFRDNCNQETCYYGYLQLPNAKLDGNFTINLTPDGQHPFSLKALQDYCSSDKKLCRIIIPDAISDAV